MYTVPQKLAETIALQQRLLREAMIEQAHMLRASSGKGGMISGTTNDESGREGRMEESVMKQFEDCRIQDSCEWKVKTRIVSFSFFWSAN